MKKTNKTVKLSDYVIDFIAKLGVRHIFLLPGGGCIHLIDSAGTHNKITYVCNHHEQGCSTAAEGYARATGNIGVCIVTTGPGGTNAITGMLGTWLDSIPMMVISGQIRRETIGAGKPWRQLGDQEINIVDVVKPITKYAAMVMDPDDIRYHLEKAVYLAKNGRPGPVWLDIPLDLQGWFIEEKNLKKFDKKELKPEFETDRKKLEKIVSKTIEKLRVSKRPVFYAGIGIRLAGAEKEFLQLVNMLKIPVLTSYAGYDLISSDHPYFFGRAHAFGQRAANFILQNSDVLLSVGARLDIRTIGYTSKAFARAAYKVVVDIDKHELKKPFFKPDLPVNYDAIDFIKEMIRQLKKKPLKLGISKWLNYGKDLNKRYPVVLKEYWREKKNVNQYCFIETIGKYLKKNELIVVSNGLGPLNCMYQAFHVKPGQRILLNNGCAQMGYGLPAAIGAAFATNGKKRVICFEGDGSLHLNIHELRLVSHHNLPIKIFLYDNDGYQAIRNTQQGLFGGRIIAADASSGLTFPDWETIGKAYKLKTVKINNHSDMERKIKKVLSMKGPVFCIINTVKDLPLVPKLAAKKLPSGQFVSPPLEDMAPFLPRDEFKKNMIIPLWQE